MNILDYAKRVKSVKDVELLGTLSTVTVGLQDLKENLKKMDLANIDISALGERWIVASSIMKGVKQDGSIPGNMILTEMLDMGADSAISTAAELQVLIKKYNQKVWSGHTLTIPQTNILNMIEHLEFWTNYSSMLVDVLLTQYNQATAPDRYMTKADVRWINGTKDFYVDFSKQLMKGSRHIISILKSMDELEVEEDVVDVLESSKGIKSVSVATRGFGIHNVNPLYWYDSIKEKVDLWRIDNMRRNNEMFAMKINQAINKKNGQNDPQLDRQIEVYQDEIIKNRAKIESIIESYN
ncbi:hypothetical protein RISINGSUN_64 [Erwinia phage vB_EamM_RisingSun]|uniref:Virion structural protein n=1 Tax=Erwinia phage vB_EamM_RisingSun TaxID=2026080 RepID=A0A223LJ76_9CAUD|nr:hypothetical protein FDI45_gp064 [Erwinia phage vB_EamM_RisingSun]ASU03606.1 hypothetical protein RISINGSUN_64 [Erwinia phage vB_EamM_RisingSun]